MRALSSSCWWLAHLQPHLGGSAHSSFFALSSFLGLECVKCQFSWSDGEFSTNAEYYLVNMTRIDSNFTW